MMNRKIAKIRKIVLKTISYLVLTALGIVFIYPLLFMLSASLLIRWRNVIPRLA